MRSEGELARPGTSAVRDLGGLPTRSGGTTRPRSIVRSGGLDRLTADGWEALHAHGVRTCIDLRSSFEVVDRPYEPTVDDVVRAEACLSWLDTTVWSRDAGSLQATDAPSPPGCRSGGGCG